MNMMYLVESRECSLWWRKDSVSSSSTVSARSSYTASVVQSHWINITEVNSILSKLIRATHARHRTWWADELAQSWVEFTHHQSMKLWKKGRCRNFEEGGYWPSYGRSMRSLRQSDVPVISSSLEERDFFRQNNLTLEGLLVSIRRGMLPTYSLK